MAMLPQVCFPKDNNMRPICVNHGCDDPVTYSRKDTQGNERWRPHCGHCQAASWGKWPHRVGVTPFKTGKCNNRDGHLGFKCLIKWSLVPKGTKGMTEIDHIDSDSSNNDLDNLDELCPICHKLKGQIHGDYNKTKRHPAKPILGYKGKKRVNALFAFEELFRL
jgi:hypothetical protein